MTAASANAGARRAPVQRRSRERVQQILDAASELIVESGLTGLSTRLVAERAGIPVASLYQYFGDRDEIILALVERDTAETDTAVTAAVRALDSVSVRTIVTATMRAFVTTYHQRPAFVVIWWRGRTNRAVYDFCRAHNKRIAADLFAFAREAGLVKADTVPRVVELAVEVGDRIFQLAFEDDIRGDEMVIDEGIEMVIGYLERHAAHAAPPATARL
ncbi:TetR/AcrR family transcriptional regulator [Actinoallomurus bryophytorum]|uniref:TetR family transcriptional regulator n=1 Tax=Actinoallomurus bryophytorum TaxID=1490222 RepID=A0A543CV19_9ACTN|nr:TetR/AcrR family transcriptional regulator [Actinoallomurus bryophytorum]TQM00955.1 TetR family transcriptional regulator [Actinoallomurus bryophytorum]